MNFSIKRSLRNMWSILDFQIACPHTKWNQGKFFILLYSDVLVGHILIQNFCHQRMPPWNWTSLWHWVSDNAILTGTSQLLDKTFSAVSLLYSHLGSSHKGARSREVSGLCPWQAGLAAPELWLWWDPGGWCSEISLAFLKLYTSHIPEHFCPHFPRLRDL